MAYSARVRRERGILWAGAIAVLAIGLVVRLWAIGTEPMWLDEAYSAYAADHGFAFLWQTVPRYETHPPFYYSLLRLWTIVFGNGLLALRLLGAAAGLATLAVVALAARAAAQAIDCDAARARRLVIVAFALACVAIPLVEMARQVRPYPLMILAYAAATLLLLRIARTRTIGGGGFIAYLLLVEATLWLHNMGPLYAVALTIALGCALIGQRLGQRDWAWLIGGHIAVGLLYLPGFLILLNQAPTWVSTTWLRFSFASLGDHLPMLYAAPGWPCLAAAILVALALTGIDSAGAGARTAALLLALALVPLILSVALSVLVAPVFITRTMAPLIVPALLLYAIGAVAWHDWRRWIGLGSALFLGANMLAVDYQARAQGNGQPWYELIAWLAPRFHPGDQIFAYPNEGALPLSYALRDTGEKMPIRAIPRAVPAFDEAGGHYVTGSRGVVSLPRWRLRGIARDASTQAVPTVWLLRLGPETYDPGDVFLDELRHGRHVSATFRAGAADLVGLTRDAPISPTGPARNPQ